MAYPPEPWRLRGRMTASIWAVPIAELPDLPVELASVVRVVRIGRHGLIGTAWVDYQPGGDMAYHELLSAVLVHRGLRTRVTITHIWVDSVDSRDGGRALWGIPKELAEFALGDTEAQARAAEATLARALMTTGVRVPLRWPIGLRVMQALAGKPKTTGVRASARLGLSRVRWQIQPDGPLRFLSGRQPLVSVVASDFRMRFGARARAPEIAEPRHTRA